jgi:16S rRNA (guanine527-N7)-methyltransferase
VEKWGPWLAGEATRLFGLTLEARQLELLGAHVAELLRWNAVVNLTSLTDPAAIAELHLLDSLAIVPHVPPGSRVLDVGAGGGFPGLPLAIVRPDVHVRMVDRTAKKAAFLASTAARLGLANAEAAQERIEAGQGADYDVAVSRALTDPAAWLGLGRGLVKAGGRVLVMLGSIEPTEAERAAALGPDRLLLAERYALPGGAQRGLWVVSRETREPDVSPIR